MIKWDNGGESDSKVSHKQRTSRGVFWPAVYAGPRPWQACWPDAWGQCGQCVWPTWSRSPEPVPLENLQQWLRNCEQLVQRDTDSSVKQCESMWKCRKRESHGFFPLRFQKASFRSLRRFTREFCRRKAQTTDCRSPPPRLLELSRLNGLCLQWRSCLHACDLGRAWDLGSRCPVGLLLPVWPSASYLSSLTLVFFTYKMRMAETFTYLIWSSWRHNEIMFLSFRKYFLNASKFYYDHFASTSAYTSRKLSTPFYSCGQ